MEYHHSTGLPARARRRQPPARAQRPEPLARAQRAEPSWPTVIGTTLRLWFERHPVLGKRGARKRRAVTLAAVGAVALGAGVTGVVVGHPAASSPAAVSASSSAAAQAQGPGSGPVSTGALGASAATRGAAAKWVAGQVAASAVVACDPAMCAALQADGLPATRLLVLGTASADPLGSDLVVATAAVRNQFGARLESVYAPVVIASFGSGSGQIDIRAIAPDGTAAYQSALAADRRGRISAGAQLLRNPRITVAAGARAALSAGDVDPRLLMMLAALAEDQPLRISGFGDASPGAGPAVPLRGAQLAPLRSGAQAESGLRSMLSFVNAQQQPFLPLRASLIGKSALTVEYAAPSPLGLLSGP
jgi:hypothetical protein